MTAKPLPKDEAGAQQRFHQAIKNALAMSPRPHKPKAAPESKTPDKTSGGVEKRGAESKPKGGKGSKGAK